MLVAMKFSVEMENYLGLRLYTSGYNGSVRA
jgi:hypothetical protein